MACERGLPCWGEAAAEADDALLRQPGSCMAPDRLDSTRPDSRARCIHREWPAARSCTRPSAASLCAVRRPPLRPLHQHCANHCIIQPLWPGRALLRAWGHRPAATRPLPLRVRAHPSRHWAADADADAPDRTVFSLNRAMKHRRSWRPSVSHYCLVLTLRAGRQGSASASPHHDTGLGWPSSRP